MGKTQTKPAKPAKPLTWQAAVVKRIGATVKKVRGTKSAAWLSDRTYDLGYRIPAGVISKLDSGHRGSVLSVPELLILAAALDVPPLGLVFPDLPAGQVDIIPNTPGSSLVGYLWAAGMGPSIADPGAQPPLSLLVNAAREQWAANQEIARLITPASTEPDPETREAYQAALKAARLRLAKLNTRISDLGGVLTDA